MSYKRNKILKDLEKNLAFKKNLLQFLLGPRQVGKTTTIQQFLKEWPHPALYATADRLTPPDVQFIEEHWLKARQLSGQMPLLVIDEVQKVHRWSEAVKKFHDEDVLENRKLRVILLGSSSLLLQKGMTESLAGRFMLLRCQHWSYPECREAFGWTLDQYLFFGGYPGASEYINDFEAWKNYIQNSLLETVIGRDVPALQPIQNPALFRQTLHLACLHPAETISLQKLLGQLQHPGSVPTLAHYLNLLSAAFLVDPVQRWSPKPLRVRASIPKLIVRNNALINASRHLAFPKAFEDRDFYGRLVENSVGAALINAGEEVFYWRERDLEVDFVVRRGTELTAIEVKSGRAKRPAALKAFQARNPDCRLLQISPQGGDLSLAQFFEKGFA